ncbi:MAG: hypothetical protein HHJ11_16250 [Phycicoccus sp.]|nr:hypothetical protein [Phycicoccus sp.]
MGQEAEVVEMSVAEAEGVVPEDFDRLNLEQALIDFEIANARVVDLASRVTALSSELLRLRSEVGDTRLELAQARAESDVLRAQDNDMRASLAYRTARMLGDARARLIRR